MTKKEKKTRRKKEKEKEKEKEIKTENGSKKCQNGPYNNGERFFSWEEKER